MAVTLPSGEFAYTLHETLGVGSAGKVKRGVHKLTGDEVAVKVVDVPAAQLAAALRESDIHAKIDHPNVVNCRGRHMQDDGKLLLVLELVNGGELFEYLVKNGRQSEGRARSLFRQLISAVHHCHERNVCHRDIKPENLLLAESGERLMVADFGYAQWMHSISDGSRGWVETSCGSPHYAAPEVIGGQRYIGKQADVWSCGVVLFALITGGLPFDDENIQTLLRQVVRGRYNIPSSVPMDVAGLIQKMLVVDPAQRITTQQILQHPWVAAGAPAPPAAAAVRTVGRFQLQRLPSHEEHPDATAEAMAVSPASRPHTPQVPAEQPMRESRSRSGSSCALETVAELGSCGSLNSLGSFVSCASFGAMAPPVAG